VVKFPLFLLSLSNSYLIELWTGYTK